MYGKGFAIYAAIVAYRIMWQPKKKRQVSKSHMNLRHMLFSFCCHLTHYATIAAYLYAAKSFSKCIDECEQIGTITSIRVFRRYLSNFIFSSN